MKLNITYELKTISGGRKAKWDMYAHQMTVNETKNYIGVKKHAENDFLVSL